MFNPINSILFATNLTPACRPAFEVSISLAAQYHASLILLHVLDGKIPAHIENEIKESLGQKWEAIKSERQQDARQALIGKMSSESLATTAIHLYCDQAGINDVSCGISSYKAIVKKGDVITSILTEAANFDCDMIVIGAQKNFLKNNSLGSIVKGVMRKTKIPVIFVPPRL